MRLIDADKIDVFDIEFLQEDFDMIDYDDACDAVTNYIEDCPTVNPLQEVLDEIMIIECHLRQESYIKCKDGLKLAENIIKEVMKKYDNAD